jgi:uncharacterized protein (DUF1015 family)
MSRGSLQETALQRVSLFLPFHGVRYRLDAGETDVGAVAAPPYDVIDEEERAALEASDPHNAVRLILPRDDGATDRYAAAAARFAAWQEDGTLRADPEPRFYRYAMRFRDEDGRERTTVGVLGALTLPRPGDPPAVLPHEETMRKAKSDRLALLQATRANFDPIWGLSLGTGVSDLLSADGDVLAHCTDDDGVEHELRAFAGDPAALSAAVAAAPVVIADGHHRFETAKTYTEQQEEAGTDAPGAGAILALVVELADEQLCVRSIHRVISGLGGVDPRAVLAGPFRVVDQGPNTPDGVAALRRAMDEAGALGLVDRAGLALLVPVPSELAPLVADRAAPVRELDATRFEAAIRPRLGDAELAFRADAAAVAALVEKGTADAAVLTRPVSVDEIRTAALAEVRMPQKTSYFFPKPRTGMVFRSLPLEDAPREG